MWIKLEPEKGENIRHACEQAARLAKFLKNRLTFEFNGICIPATADSVVSEMVDFYRIAFELRATRDTSNKLISAESGRVQ